MKTIKIGTATLIHGDCEEFMRDMPDKCFDLACIDPPYGIGISSNPVRQMHTKKSWDDSIPECGYFSKLMSVSANQIIWGGNYFNLGRTRGFIIWDKLQYFKNFSACEFAWTSFQKPSAMYQIDC